MLQAGKIPTAHAQMYSKTKHISPFSRRFCYVLSGLSHKDYITRYVSKHTVFADMYSVFNNLTITVFSTAFLVKSLSAMFQLSAEHRLCFLVPCV